VVELKTPTQIEAMHAAGVVVAYALSAVRSQAAVGVRLASLDQVARSVLADAGVVSLSRLPAQLRLVTVPGGDLNLGQRRCPARHPGWLPGFADANVALPLLMGKSRHKNLRSLQRYVHPCAEAVAATTAAHDPAARRRRY